MTLSVSRVGSFAEIRAAFDREVKGYRDEVQKLQRQLDSSVAAFEQQSIALSPAAKQAKQKDLQAQQQRMEQRSNELQQRAQQREQELMAPIQARINAVIQGLRAEGNYSVIFDADAQGGAVRRLSCARRRRRGAAWARRRWARAPRSWAR